MRKSGEGSGEIVLCSTEMAQKTFWREKLLANQKNQGEMASRYLSNPTVQPSLDIYQGMVLRGCLLRQTALAQTPALLLSVCDWARGWIL